MLSNDPNCLRDFIAIRKTSTRTSTFSQILEKLVGGEDGDLGAQEFFAPDRLARKRRTSGFSVVLRWPTA